MKYTKLIINLVLIIIISYLGFTLYNVGELNPVYWVKEHIVFFISIIITCIIAFLVFTIEPPGK